MAETVLGDYTVVRTLADDPAYRWLKAAATGEQGRVYVLQVIKPEVPAAVLPAIRDYFTSLIALNHPALRTPDACKGDATNPLVIRYGAGEFDAAPLAPSAPPLNRDGLPALRAWSRKAADALTALHAQGLTHGCLTIDDFTLIGGQLVLAGLGYAPLLNAGYPGILRWRANAHAPEIRAGGRVTPTADVYGFAQAVLTLMPELAETPWQERATDPDPARRFSSIAETWAVLDKAMEAYIVEPPTVRGQPSVPLAPLPPQPTPKLVHEADTIAANGRTIVSEARIPAEGRKEAAVLAREGDIFPAQRPLDPTADNTPRGLLVSLFVAAIVIGLFVLGAVTILPRLLPSPASTVNGSPPAKKTAKTLPRVEKRHRGR